MIGSKQGGDVREAAKHPRRKHVCLEGSKVEKKENAEQREGKRGNDEGWRLEKSSCVLKEGEEKRKNEVWNEERMKEEAKIETIEKGRKE